MERWFTERRKNKVMDMAYRQMTVALDTANDLERAIGAVSIGDTRTATMAIERLFQVEVEIDNLRRAVFEELAKGNLEQKAREDIMHLVKRLDMMADHIKDSARNVLVLKDALIPQELWNAFHEMSKGIVMTAAMLKESISNLTENPSKARTMSEKVEEEENKVDKHYMAIKSLFLKYEGKLGPSALILLKDLLDSMEEAADSCADTGDYVRVLTVRFKDRS